MLRTGAGPAPVPWRPAGLPPVFPPLHGDPGRKNGSSVSICLTSVVSVLEHPLMASATSSAGGASSSALVGGAVSRWGLEEGGAPLLSVSGLGVAPGDVSVLCVPAEGSSPPAVSCSECTMGSKEGLPPTNGKGQLFLFS